jgi:hypothetical protein
MQTPCSRHSYGAAIVVHASTCMLCRHPWAHAATVHSTHSHQQRLLAAWQSRQPPPRSCSSLQQALQLLELFVLQFGRNYEAAAGHLVQNLFNACRVMSIIDRHLWGIDIMRYHASSLACACHRKQQPCQAYAHKSTNTRSFARRSSGKAHTGCAICPPVVAAVKKALLRVQKLTASMVGLSHAAPSTADASPAVELSVQFWSTSCNWL